MDKYKTIIINFPKKLLRLKVMKIVNHRQMQRNLDLFENLVYVSDDPDLDFMRVDFDAQGFFLDKF